MEWTVANHEAFDPEFYALPEPVRLALLAELMLLRTYGPALGRPHVDTLSGSKHANTPLDIGDSPGAFTSHNETFAAMAAFAAEFARSRGFAFVDQFDFCPLRSHRCRCG